MMLEGFPPDKLLATRSWQVFRFLLFGYCSNFQAKIPIVRRERLSAPITVGAVVPQSAISVGRKNTVRRLWRCQLEGEMFLLRRGWECLCTEAGCRPFMAARQAQSGLLQGAARNASKSWHKFLRSKT
jgi:hypothetical protein